MAHSSCNSCGSASSVITDLDTGSLVCCACGSVLTLSTDTYVNQIPLTSSGGIDFSAASYVPNFTYHDRKIKAATVFLKGVASRLGISDFRANEAVQLAHDATEGKFALEGTMFLNDLSAASIYLVARRHNLPLSISEVASSVGSDPHDLGELIKRISRVLKLPPLPNFDLGASLERAVKNSQLLQNSQNSQEIIGQGRFLLNCCTKWSLSTGRHPLPVVAAVFTLVAQVNGYGGILVDDVAIEMGLVVSTSRVRYKELVETLVRVARVLLPWGKDVSVANLVHSAGLLIRLMELKSKSSGFGFLEGFKVDNLLSSVSDGFSVGGGEEDEYLRNDKREIGFNEVDDVKISGERVLSANENVVERIERLKNGAKRKRWFGGEFEDNCWGLDLDAKRWKGMKNMSDNEILNMEVGFDAPPPSFVKGVEVRELRRERIKAAKCRIKKVKTGCDDLKEGFVEKKKKKKRGRTRKGGNGCMDWEDCVIELLLLHGVNEREIEDGHYRRLLDLHVYGS